MSQDTADESITQMAGRDDQAQNGGGGQRPLETAGV